MWVSVKNMFLIFSLFKTVFFFFYFFCLVYIKWLTLWTSLNISIETVMKNPEMLKFVLDHLKTKKCVSIQLKSYLIY